MSRLQRSFLNMICGAAGYVVPLLVAFISTPLLLSGLGEAGFGLQNLVGVIIGYLGIMDMNLDTPIVKYLAEDHARDDRESECRLLSATLQLYMLIGIVGMVAIVMGADVLIRRVFMIPAELVEPARVVFRLAGVGFLANMFSSWGRAIVNGLQRYDISNSISVSTTSAATAIGVLVMFAGYGVVGYVFVRILGYLAAGGAHLLVIPRLLPSFRVRWGLDREMLRRIRVYVSSGVVLRLSGMLMVGLDRTLIGAWMGVAAVGVYAVPYLVVNSISNLFGAMLHFTFPMASELHSTNRLGELRAIYAQANRSLAGVASVVFPLMLVLGDRFLVLWVGRGMAEKAAGVFGLMLLAGYIWTLTVILANFVMVGTGHILSTTAYSLTKTGLVSAGYVFLIRSFGLEGAGMALLIGSTADVSWLYFTLSRFLRVTPTRFFLKVYLRPLLLGAAVSGLGFLVKSYVTSWLTLIGMIAILPSIYIWAGFRFGVFAETEKRVLMGLWRVAKQGGV